jgi:hypothetical protein
MDEPLLGALRSGDVATASLEFADGPGSCCDQVNAGASGAAHCRRSRHEAKPRLVRRPPAGPTIGPRGFRGCSRALYAARGAVNLEQAQPRLAKLLPPDLLGMDAAIALLSDAMADGSHIVVVGDFDCDGATACAVGVRGLRMLGARHVSYAVPNRMVHGYGLSPRWWKSSRR